MLFKYRNKMSAHSSVTALLIQQFGDVCQKSLSKTKLSYVRSYHIIIYSALQFFWLHKRRWPMHGTVNG